MPAPTRDRGHRLAAYRQCSADRVGYAPEVHFGREGGVGLGGSLFGEMPIARIERVAQLYRRLVLVVGAQLLAICGLTAVIAALAGQEGSVSEGVLGMVNLVVRLVLIVVGMITGYQLATELGIGNAALWAVGMLVPCVNLLVVLGLSSKANGWCQAAGVEVGLLGPTRRALQRVRESQGGSLAP